MIALPEMSAFSELGNLDALERNVRVFLIMDFDDIQNKVLNIYSKDVIAQNDLYYSLVTM